MILNPKNFKVALGSGLEIKKEEFSLIFGEYPINKGYYVREAIKNERYLYFDNEGRGGDDTINCDGVSFQALRDTIRSSKVDKSVADFVVIDSLESFYDFSVPALRLIVRTLAQKEMGLIAISHQKNESSTTKFANMVLMFDKAIKLF